MFKDLITYTELYDACSEYFQFGGVVFLRDFGPWKKGDKIECISFNIEENAETIQSDEKGDTIKSCKFQLVAL